MDAGFQCRLDWFHILNPEIRFRVGVRVEGCSGAGPGPASTSSIAVRVRQAGQAGRSLGQEVESQVTRVCV